MVKVILDAKKFGHNIEELNVGGGLGIISVCDFAIADTEAKFCFSEVRLGFCSSISFES